MANIIFKGAYFRGFARVKYSNNRWNIMDKSEKILCPKASFDFVGTIQDDAILVCLNQDDIPMWICKVNIYSRKLSFGLHHFKMGMQSLKMRITNIMLSTSKGIYYFLVYGLNTYIS